MEVHMELHMETGVLVLYILDVILMHILHVLLMHTLNVLIRMHIFMFCCCCWQQRGLHCCFEISVTEQQRCWQSGCT